MMDPRQAAMGALGRLEEDADYGEHRPEGKRPKLVLTIEQSGDCEVKDGDEGMGEEPKETLPEEY